MITAQFAIGFALGFATPFVLVGLVCLWALLHAK